MRQDAMIPGWSPAGLLLIRTDDVAVAVGGVRGYPNGFEFTVHVRLRQQGSVCGTGPFDSLADPRTAPHGHPNRRSGSASCTPNGRRAVAQSVARPPVKREGSIPVLGTAWRLSPAMRPLLSTRRGDLLTYLTR